MTPRSFREELFKSGSALHGKHAFTFEAELPHGFIARAERVGDVTDMSEADFRGKKRYSLVFFPRDEAHARRFEEASGARIPNGPSELFPGCVGALVVREEDDPRVRTIEQIQYGVKIASTQREKKEPKTVKNAEFADFADWRLHALRHALESARDEGVRQVFFDVTHAGPDTHGKPVGHTHADAFRHAATALGFNVEDVTMGPQKHLRSVLAHLGPAEE